MKQTWLKTLGMLWIIGLLLTGCGGSGAGSGGGDSTTIPGTSAVAVQNLQVTPLVSESIVSKTGGSLAISDAASNWNGARLDIPAGALPSDMTITVSDISSFEYDGSLGVQKALKLEPSGTTFTTPLPFTIPYDPSLSDAEIEAQRYYILDEATNSMQELPVASIDKAAKTVRVNIPHFSVLISAVEIDDIDYLAAANEIKRFAEDSTLKNYDATKMALFLSNADIALPSGAINGFRFKDQQVSAKELYLLYKISHEQDASKLSGAPGLTPMAAQLMRQYFKIRSEHYGDTKDDISVFEDWLEFAAGIGWVGYLDPVKKIIEVATGLDLTTSLQDVIAKYIEFGVTLGRLGAESVELRRINDSINLLENNGVDPSMPLNLIPSLKPSPDRLMLIYLAENPAFVHRANFARLLGGWGKQEQNKQGGIRFRRHIEGVLKTNLQEFETKYLAEGIDNITLDFGSDTVRSANSNTIFYLNKGKHTIKIKTRECLLNKEKYGVIDVNSNISVKSIKVSTAKPNQKLTEVKKNLLGYIPGVSDSWDIGVDSQATTVQVNVVYEMVFPSGAKKQYPVTKTLTLKQTQQQSTKSINYIGNTKPANNKLPVKRGEIKVIPTANKANYKIKALAADAGTSDATDDYPFNKITGQLFDSKGAAIGNPQEMGHEKMDFTFPSDGKYTIKITATPYLPPQDFEDGELPVAEGTLDVTVGNPTDPPPATAGTIKLPKTGQTTSYAARDDGDLETGETWPDPRFTDNNNGTITDNLTGLVWLKNANCIDTVAGIVKKNGHLTWANALTWSNGLASGACGLSDGSQTGQWRLPNIVELESLIDSGRYNPALPSGHPFSSVQSGYYLSSSTLGSGTAPWIVFMYYGCVYLIDKGNDYSYVWPVRAGQ